MPAHPPIPTPIPSEVIVLEAAPGRGRRERLDRWLDDARADGATGWLLPCDTDNGGVWAGVSHWMEALLPAIEAEAPKLVVRHDTELLAVLPELRRRMSARYVTLTETAPAEEAVRNYALDRAYRFGHGLINLLDEWHARTGGGRWVVVCDGFDRRGALVGRFFRELMRRRGEKLGITLLVAVDPGHGDEAAAFFDGSQVRRVSVDLPAEPAPALDAGEARRAARALEREVAGDSIATLLHLHELIRLWSASDLPARGTAWRTVALGMYTHMGYYEDALKFAPAVRASLPAYTPEGQFYPRWNLISNLFSTYSALRMWDEAYGLMMEQSSSPDPFDRARVLYRLAMLHVRFLPKRDLAEGERCLHEAVAELERAEIPAEQKHFVRAFLLNGLALVRTRQGRAAEAIDLTRTGFDRLNEELPPERHRLHRSVLLYNTAQVYANTGAMEEAVRSYTAVMAMDPGYSEYYNERGNAYLKMGRFADAERDYRQAIETSPPYAEVWVNLGQCYRAMRRLDEAVDAYGVALDLDPDFHLGRVGRAHALLMLGRRAEALLDFDAAIALEPGHALVLAARAAVLYEEGRIPESVRDLDQAISLTPDDADLYRNRALALRAAERDTDAAADLETYLRLVPTAPDRADLEAQIDTLRSVPQPA